MSIGRSSATAPLRRQAFLSLGAALVLQRLHEIHGDHEEARDTVGPADRAGRVSLLPVFVMPDHLDGLLEVGPRALGLPIPVLVLPRRLAVHLWRKPWRAPA